MRYGTDCQSQTIVWVVAMLNCLMKRFATWIFGFEVEMLCLDLSTGCDWSSWVQTPATVDIRNRLWIESCLVPGVLFQLFTQVDSRRTMAWTIPYPWAWQERIALAWCFPFMLLSLRHDKMLIRWNSFHSNYTIAGLCLLPQSERSCHVAQFLDEIWIHVGYHVSHLEIRVRHRCISTSLYSVVQESSSEE